jgi:bifunctional DNase/RNase
MKLKELIHVMREKLINLLTRKQKSNKIKLDILGISYTKSGDQTLYIVILGEEGGSERKVPVIINYFEAQAIAIEVEKISPIVPLVYDVLKHVIEEHKVKFEEIFISDFKNDILLTHIVGKKENIELRTADALAISVRMGYPIYIEDEVLTKVDEIVKKYYDIKKGTQVIADSGRLHGFTLSELNDLLQKAIDEEEYEKASEIRDEIIKKKKEGDEDQ